MVAVSKLKGREGLGEEARGVEYFGGKVHCRSIHLRVVCVCGGKNENGMIYDWDAQTDA